MGNQKMKNGQANCVHSACTALGRVLACVVLCSGLVSSPAHAQELRSPIWGGSGGNKNYQLSCGKGAVMTGMTAKFGSWIDQIGVVCRKVNENGTLGDEFTRGPVGGQGGSSSTIRRCDPGEVIGGAYGGSGWYIDYIGARCYPWDARSRRLDARDTTPKYFRIGNSPLLGPGSWNWFTCGTKPAKGLRGKHGSYVDSLQFFCNDWNQ
jgi:hypothetical protein